MINGESNGNGSGDRYSDVEPGYYRRLERAFSEQEREFQSTRDDVNTLKNTQSVIQRDIAGLATSIQAVGTKLDEKSRTNWPALALGVAMFGIAIPGLGFVMTSYTANALAPIVSGTTINAENLRHLAETVHTLESAAAASAAADVTSRGDRAQLNDRLRIMESTLASEIGDRRANSAATKVSLAEIESQFHALSNVENLRAAQQERLNSMMWEKSHPGERYPNGTFFPTSIFQGPSEQSAGSP
jgi:hypothetical protein